MKKSVEMRRHRRSGDRGADRAYVYLDGERVYLGRWGSEQAKARFEQSETSRVPSPFSEAAGIGAPAGIQRTRINSPVNTSNATAVRNFIATSSKKKRTQPVAKGTKDQGNVATGRKPAIRNGVRGVVASRRAERQY